MHASRIRRNLRVAALAALRAFETLQGALGKTKRMRSRDAAAVFTMIDDAAAERT